MSGDSKNDEPAGTDSELARVQNWMQAVISHPSGIAAGIASADARHQIDIDAGRVEEVILPSRRNSSLERLEVYGNAYYARLLECLESIFPALTHALGEELFREFAFGYLQRWPSSSYTLGRLADRFEQFLEESRAEQIEPHEPGPEATHRGDSPDPTDFFIELARLEWHIQEVFDGPGVEQHSPLSADALKNIPAERWPEARLITVPCLKLLPFQFPVSEYFTAFRRGDHPPLPAPRRTWLAMWRRDWVVRRLELSAAQFELLSALQAGQTVGQAITRTAATCGDVDQLAAALENWFRLWAAEGIFWRVEV